MIIVVAPKEDAAVTDIMAHTVSAAICFVSKVAHESRSL